MNQLGGLKRPIDKDYQVQPNKVGTYARPKIKAVQHKLIAACGLGLWYPDIAESPPLLSPFSGRGSFASQNLKCDPVPGWEMPASYGRLLESRILANRIPSTPRWWSRPGHHGILHEGSKAAATYTLCLDGIHTLNLKHS